MLEAASEDGAGSGASGSSFESPSPAKRRIARTLIDQDFCLSMLDKISLANERRNGARAIGAAKIETIADSLVIPNDAAARLAYSAADPAVRAMPFEEFKSKFEAETMEMVSAKKKPRDKEDDHCSRSNATEVLMVDEEKTQKSRLAFWRARDPSAICNEKGSPSIDRSAEAAAADSNSGCELTSSCEPTDVEEGGVLLNTVAPTVTRQLNTLSNIVRRTLLYGGDQEVLVLAETLAADRPAFVRRWHPDADRTSVEPPPSLRYFDTLITLLRTCYARGVLAEVPPFPALDTAETGYQNAYSRLAAALIEGGSGYVRPASRVLPGLSLAMTTTAATARYLASTAPPRNAMEELGRFAKWETAVRKNRENPYPEE